MRSLLNLMQIKGNGTSGGNCLTTVNGGWKFKARNNKYPLVRCYVACPLRDDRCGRQSSRSHRTYLMIIDRRRRRREGKVLLVVPRSRFPSLKWKQNDQSTSRERERETRRRIAAQENKSWLDIIDLLLDLLFDSPPTERRRHSTCAAVSCPDGLIARCHS